MPLAFPSHQGLILPVWRLWPRRIDGVALCVGAAMPDLVDAVAWPFRGELAQWLGHSFVGIAACVATGLPLVWLARRALPQRWVSRLDEGAPPSPSLARAAASLAIGALSHDAFDLVTHGNFLLLWPWCAPAHAFPDAWYRTWATIPLPVYREPYPIAPHTIAWLALTILGIVLFFACVRAPTKNGRAPRSPS